MLLFVFLVHCVVGQVVLPDVTFVQNQCTTFGGSFYTVTAMGSAPQNMIACVVVPPQCRTRGDNCIAVIENGFTTLTNGSITGWTAFGPPYLKNIQAMTPVPIKPFVSVWIDYQVVTDTGGDWALVAAYIPRALVFGDADGDGMPPSVPPSLRPSRILSFQLFEIGIHLF